ncbi:ClpXP protease specificity-enhancing factor [Pseudidiomarina insulisalsae]|uniref:ClpXP protease specificity-enhancing factor n=2 Tax=Pseudidiomarina insulisalsae TaxID=575789 RepID=A0A432YNX7_9GAMM|nr:ClpXP protease specificity-enhancing factor [Pseudidiomarina insulisalsae]
MSARRPYMLRAVYEWLVDNQLTPHLVVDANQPGCQVPFEFVQDGQIVLNIAPSAVGNLQLANDRVEFNARFSGKPHHVYVPMVAVVALYARENGAGTIFEEEPQLEELTPSETPEAPKQGPSDVIQGRGEGKGEGKGDKASKGKRPNLKVIK